MPHSVNPRQGFLDNWNTKPSQQAFYQQNSGDEYWGTIFRSQLISQLAQASTTISVSYLEGIEHTIGTIDNGDNTRPAARYFIPYLVRAYQHLVRAGRPARGPRCPPRPAAGGPRAGALERRHHAGQPGHVDLHELPGGLRAQRVRGRPQSR